MVRRGLYIGRKISELDLRAGNKEKWIKTKAVKGFQEIQNLHKKKRKNKKVIEWLLCWDCALAKEMGVKIIKNTRDWEQRQVGFAIVCVMWSRKLRLFWGVLGKENEKREKEMVILFWFLSWSGEIHCFYRSVFVRMKSVWKGKRLHEPSKNKKTRAYRIECNEESAKSLVPLIFNMIIGLSWKVWILFSLRAWS